MSDAAFKIGIIGAGGIAAAHFAAAKASGGRVVVAAIAEPLQANREKASAENDAAAFASAEAMFAAVKSGDLHLDGVIVCTPPSIRTKIIEATFKAKLPVLMEKPIAHTLADAKKLASLATKHKKVLSFVAYCHRFAPPINEMKAMVAAGKIGTLVRVENAFACDLPSHAEKWFSDVKQSGGGAFLDMGSHSIDLFNYLTSPSKTLASVFSNKWKKRTETAATVLVQSTKKAGANIPAGVAGVIISGWAEASRFTLTLVGNAGTLSYDYEKPTELLFKDLLGAPTIHTVPSHDTRFQLQLVAFADAVQHKKKSQLATFAHGLAAATGDAKARR